MVKRYDVVWSNTDEAGDFVSYADYAALAERCERLEDALDAIRQELREASADNRAFVRTDVLQSLILQASGGKE